MRRSPFAPLLRPVSRLVRRVLVGPVPDLFDPAYYRANNPAVDRSGLDAYLHFVWKGAARDRNPNADFDTAFYRKQAGPIRLDPVRHYLSEGAAAGLDPGPAFSTRFYLAHYPDVVQAGINPLRHFRNNGRAEGRQAAPSPIAPERLRVLGGVAEAHLWSLPEARGQRFELGLLRQVPLAACPCFAPRLCVQLALDGAECEGLVAAFRTFEDGVQDALRLRIDTGASPHPPAPTLLLAFECCHFGVSEDGRTATLRYAEVKLWDLRGRKAGVAPVFPAGAVSVRRLGPEADAA